MSRKNIYDKDVKYNILKPIVDWCTRRSYRRIQVQGLDNIPNDGAVFLAPNHCNTLMDALVVLQATREAKVFGARADMFNNPFVAKLMYFFRILPMVRQRDGLRNVLKNLETFDIIVDTLENGVPFCMFPEGRHRPAHSLLPLGKGVMRAAIAANNRLEGKKPVYIVPTGLEYGDYFRYRSTCLINYGKPINVTELIKELNVENEAQIMEPIRKLLQEKMSELITYIPYDEDYDKVWALTKILAREDARNGSLSDRMAHNKHVIEQIRKAREIKPEEMEALLDEALRFEKERKKKGLSIWSFGKRCTRMCSSWYR